MSVDCGHHDSSSSLQEQFVKVNMREEVCSCFEIPDSCFEIPERLGMKNY